MNSMGMPGDVKSRPVANRERLRAYHDRLFESVGQPGHTRAFPVEDDVVVLEVGHRPPGRRETLWRINTVADRVERDRRG